MNVHILTCLIQLPLHAISVSMIVLVCILNLMLCCINMISTSVLYYIYQHYHTNTICIIYNMYVELCCINTTCVVLCYCCVVLMLCWGMGVGSVLVSR